MSIRRTASCCQPRQEISVPRGARTGRAPGRAERRGRRAWRHGRSVARPGPSRHAGPGRAAVVDPATLAGTMPILAVRRWADLDAAEQARLLARSTAAIFEPALMALDRGDLRGRPRPRRRGRPRRDRAVRRRPPRPRATCRVRPDEIEAAHAAVDPALLAGIREAIANSRLFNEAQLAATAPRLAARGPAGLRASASGSRRSRAAGLFVPTGKGSYPSVLVPDRRRRRSSPACRRSPWSSRRCRAPDGAVDPATLAVARELGSGERLPGERPGRDRRADVRDRDRSRGSSRSSARARPAVTAAQVLAQRFGTATQMLCGPSESLLIADDSADPWRLAIDLLNEAEHGADSAATLVDRLGGAGRGASRRRSPSRSSGCPEPRRGYATAVLGDLGGVILVDSMDEAVAFANDVRRRARPDRHRATRRRRLRGLRYAGEVLLGQDTPIGASELHDRDPGDAPDRRLRPAQRRGHRADLPDLDVDRPADARRRWPGWPGRPSRWPTTRASRPTPTPSAAAGLG